MWLLNTKLNEDDSFIPILEEFEGDGVPEYAILSHTWEEEEVLYADVSPNPETASSKKGFMKIEKAAERARLDGHAYIWIDTCCIRKDSSAELQEAINSMFQWYQRATVCYAYLSDFRHPLELQGESLDQALSLSRWFTRGWCLQELLAPTTVIFYSSDWATFGTKTSLAITIAKITSIKSDYLTGLRPIHSASVAERMSWASFRQTRRIEDMAYCLMGIFSVNMTMLYGEGPKAFLRLQKKIWKELEDQSLFMWMDPSINPATPHGLLADSPRVFSETGHCCAFADQERNPPLEISSKGVRITLRILNEKNSLYKAALNCPTRNTSCLNGTRDTASIYLTRLLWGKQQFVRVNCDRLESFPDSSGLQQTIFIPQELPRKSVEQMLYPRHTVHLRRNPTASYGCTYALTDINYPGIPVVLNGSSAPDISRKTGLDARSWISSHFPSAFEVLGPAQLTVALLIRRPQDGEQFVIILGTDVHSQLGFCILPTIARRINKDESLITLFKSHLEQSYGKLEAFRGYANLQWHRVGIFNEVHFHQNCKITILDFDLEAIWKNVKDQGEVWSAPLNQTRLQSIDDALPQFYAWVRLWPRGRLSIRPVSDLTFSPDGQTLASSSKFNPVVRLWDTATGRETGALRGPSSLSLTTDHGITAIAFSQVGSQVIAVYTDSSVCFWDFATKSDTATMLSGISNDSKIWPMAFSPDRKQIAIGYSLNVGVLNLDTETIVSMPIDLTQRITAIAFSPDGRQVAFASPETVQLRDPFTGALYVIFKALHQRSQR